MNAFRDQNYLFAEANAQVLGISVDSFAAAGEFEDKLTTGFPLLSDFPKYQTGKDYGTYNEQFGIMNRTTVIVDKNGIVRDVYTEPRDFASHAPHALEVLKSLQG
jgi:peroxiredoxin